MQHSRIPVTLAALAAVLSAAAFPCASASRAADLSAEELSAGWDYERICPPGRLERYRLRLDIALETAEGAADAAEGDPPVGGEFRVLLDRRDERNFVCLRCAAVGKSRRLELLKYVDGRRAALPGRTSSVLDELARPPEGPAKGGKPPAGESASEAGRRTRGRTIHIDRAPGLWAVSLDRAEVITAIDAQREVGTPAGEGDVAWGASGPWKLVGRKLQKMEPVYFEDGFTRRHFNEHGEYEVLYGRWWLDSVSDPGRTVNAFRLRGAGLSPGRQAVIVAGHDFWRGYRLEASIRFRGGGAAGLVFGVRDRKTLGLLRWRRPAAAGPQDGGKADAGGGRLDIIHIRPRPFREDAAPRGEVSKEGEKPRSKIKQRTLLSLPWSPRPEQWYRVAISLGSEVGEVEVNGRSAFFELPDELRCGRPGLYVNSDDGVLFDDIRVRSHEGVIARARDSIWSWAGLRRTNNMLGALAVLRSGPLRVRTSFEPGSGPLSITWPDEAGATLLRWELLLDPASSKGSVARRLLPFPFPPVERVAEFPLGRAEGGVYSAEISGKGVTLLRGRAVVYASDACATAGLSSRASRVGRAVSGTASKLAVAHASGLAAGRAGPVRLSSPGAPVKLSGLAATPLEPVAPLKRKRGGILDAVVKQGQEQHAHKWATFLRWVHDRGSWEREKEGTVLRCRTPFWGPLDAAFETELPAKVGDSVGLRLVPEEGTPVGIVIRRDESGCAVYSRLRGDVAAASAAQARLVKRDDAAVVFADDSEDGALGRYWPGEGGEGRVRLSLARAGKSVEGRIGGELFLRAELPPDAPVRVEAHSTPEAKPEPDDVEIRARCVDESLFESAPTEWARWRGHWDVTPKWDCDKRWTFLGLWSDAIDTKREAAGVFSRGSYFGDQDLHFYFAFKDVLGRRKQGRRYVRRDLNFAFACEPWDLASGYCVLVGGLDNRGVQLVRRGKLVAETDRFRFPPRGTSIEAIHWLWYELRILRADGTIRVVLDGKELITWTDPEPLGCGPGALRPSSSGRPEGTARLSSPKSRTGAGGGHVAIWTLGGGMIVARTRFSAEKRGDDIPGFDEGFSPGESCLGWRAAGKEGAVLLAESQPGVVRVTNLAGGGHMAVAYVSDAAPRSAYSAEAAASAAKAGTSLRNTSPKATGAEGAGKGRAGALAFRASEGCALLSLKMLHVRSGGETLADGSPARALPADGRWHVVPLAPSMLLERFHESSELRRFLESEDASVRPRKPLRECERLVIGSYVSPTKSSIEAAAAGKGEGGAKGDLPGLQSGTGGAGRKLPGYLAAGLGANARGAWYEVKLFTSKEKAEAFVKAWRD